MPSLKHKKFTNQHIQKLKYICLILFVVLAFFILQSGELEFKPNSESPPASTSQKLSSTEYAAIKNELETLVNQKNPATALGKLQNLMNSDQSVLRSCHPLVHVIGQSAFLKYQDFGKAMSYQNEICNSGYFHGVIETYFASVDDVLPALQNVCRNYPVDTFNGWQCYHGIGHGLMFYTENELPKSLRYCEKLSKNKESEACNNGVFMENFNTDQKTHPSKFLSNDDSFYPCTEQNEGHKPDCYLYIPTYYLSQHTNEYLRALTWCDQAESNFRPYCIHGVSGQAIKENINNPKLVESICDQLNKPDQAICINGMVSLYINHFASLEPARDLCGQLRKINHQLCKKIVNQKAFLFN
jgi:hypothetical protein